MTQADAPPAVPPVSVATADEGFDAHSRLLGLIRGVGERLVDLLRGWP